MNLGRRCVLAAAALVAAVAASRAPATPGILFDGGLDHGTYTPWSTPQCHNYGNPSDSSTTHFGNFYVDKRHAGEGAFGAEFALPAWPGGKTRCQLITRRTINVGHDDYYSLMFYVPREGFQPGTTPDTAWGVSIAEFNFQNLGRGGPTISLQAHKNHVTLVMQTGVATTSFPFHQYRSNADLGGSSNLPALYAIPRPMKKGVWHELVVRCHWATDRTGKVVVWHRLKGEKRWTRTAALSGYPTLQVNPDGSYDQDTLDVIQAYRGPSIAPVTVWVDGFARATSWAAAAANLP